MRLCRDGFNQFDLFRTQAFKNELNVRRLHPWLKIIQERIIRMFEPREIGGVFLPQGDNFLQVRPENREVRFPAGLHPGLLGQRGRLGKIDNVAGGNARGFIVVTQGQFDKPGIVRIRI